MKHEILANLRKEVTNEQHEAAARVEWQRHFIEKATLPHNACNLPQSSIHMEKLNLLDKTSKLCGLTKTKMKLIADARRDARAEGVAFEPEY